MKNKSNNQFMAMLFLALALLVGIFLVTKPARYQSSASRNMEEYTKIQTDDDLERASQSLNDVNLDSLDSTFAQNEEESGY